MGLFDWLTKKARFTRCDDVYATTRDSLWDSLRKTVTSPHHQAKSIWLVVHFTDTFAALQEELETWSVDYDVVTSPISLQAIDRTALLQSGKINLILANLIPELDSVSEYHSSLAEDKELHATIAIIMVERHPLVKHDDQVESFARAMPTPVEFGYFNSLDDVVLSHVINETTLTVLKQLGLNDHELITSTMVTRRLDKVLRRKAQGYTSDKPADSACEWLTLNGE